MFAHVTTVLFDLDGTIADTNEIIARTLAETLELTTGRPWQREELLPHWGLPLRMQLRIMHPEIDFAVAVPFYRQRYQAYHETLLAEFPGMRPVLEALRTAGYLLGVVTSKKRENARHTLEGLQYDGYFACLVCEEDCARLKPAPDPLLQAAAQLGIPAEAAIYLGDNPDDIRAAHAAGMRGVAVGWCMRPREELQAVGADAIIDHPAELLMLLGQPTEISAS